MAALASDFLRDIAIDETRAELAATRAKRTLYAGALHGDLSPALRAKTVIQVEACDRWIGYYETRLKELGA